MTKMLLKRILVYGIALIIPIVVIVYFYSFYQNQNSFSIKCFFHTTTGLWCPGCGGQRAFNFLLHGHFLKSLRYNIILPFALFIVGYLYYIVVEGWILGNKTANSKLHLPASFAINFLIFLVVYTVIRNIPSPPFIYLAPIN